MATEIKYQPRRVYVTYDPVANAAYVYFKKHARKKFGIVKRSVRKDQMIIDYAADDSIVGIEFLEPKINLPKRWWRQKGVERTYTAS